mmetsp:Transcript_18122/g.39580  ORF Transcript_18122/g.39580 Transcript_18122/m.39580 type:complete len:98 (-) Transcript_18122:1143-1436(-)
MFLNETHALMSCRLTTSAEPNPTKILPKMATCMDRYEIARAYNKFPTQGHSAENKSADRNELFVYHTEKMNAAKMAEKEEAPTRVAPNAPSVPRIMA